MCVFVILVSGVNAANMNSPAGGGTAVGEAPAIEGLVAPKARPSSSASASSSSLSNEQLARAAEIENAKRRELAVLMAQLDTQQQQAPGALSASQPQA